MFSRCDKKGSFFSVPEELSVSLLSSHNKSLALSWGWTLTASGEDKWPAGLWSALAVQMGPRRWQRNIHNSATNNENIKHSCLLTGWQKSMSWHQSSTEALPWQLVSSLILGLTSSACPEWSCSSEVYHRRPGLHSYFCFFLFFSPKGSDVMLGVYILESQTEDKWLFTYLDRLSKLAIIGLTDIFTDILYTYQHYTWY